MGKRVKDIFIGMIIAFIASLAFSLSMPPPFGASGTDILNSIIPLVPNTIKYFVALIVVLFIYFLITTIRDSKNVENTDELLKQNKILMRASVASLVVLLAFVAALHVVKNIEKNSATSNNFEIDTIQENDTPLAASSQDNAPTKDEPDALEFLYKDISFSDPKPYSDSPDQSYVHVTIDYQALGKVVKSSSFLIQVDPPGWEVRSDIENYAMSPYPGSLIQGLSVPVDDNNETLHYHSYHYFIIYSDELNNVYADYMHVFYISENGGSSNLYKIIYIPQKDWGSDSYLQQNNNIEEAFNSFSLSRGYNSDPEVYKVNQSSLEAARQKAIEEFLSA